MGITRDKLEEQAFDLGIPDIAGMTDQQLLNAIRAERDAAEWLEKFAKLPTDAARKAAAERLQIADWPEPRMPSDVNPDR